MKVEKWVGFVGTSQQVPNTDVTNGIKEAVAKAYSEGKGIILGGCVGIDAVALGEIMQWDPTGKHVKILVPTTFGSYLRQCRRLAIDHVISVEDGITFTQLLEKVRHINPQAVVEEKKSADITTQNPSEGNRRIIASSQEVEVFWTENSQAFTDLKNAVLEAYDVLEGIGFRRYRILVEKPTPES